jgi:predicted HNH restriction endonuclease
VLPNWGGAFFAFTFNDVLYGSLERIVKIQPDRKASGEIYTYELQTNVWSEEEYVKLMQLDRSAIIASFGTKDEEIDDEDGDNQEPSRHDEDNQELIKHETDYTN